MVLVSALANDDIVSDKALTRVLPAAGNVVRLAGIEIKSSGIIAGRKIEALLATKYS